MRASWDVPGIVTVTSYIYREPRDTLTEGGNMCMCMHPGIVTVTGYSDRGRVGVCSCRAT